MPKQRLKTPELLSLRNMLIATFFFSLMEVLVKSLERIPTQQIVFFRASIAFIICVVMIRRANLPFWGNNKKYLILRGVFGTCALILYFYTLKKIPLASASAIQKLSPLFTIFFAQFLLGEKVRRLSWLFFAIALGGALMIKGFDPRVPLVPFLLGVGAAIGSGLAYNCIGKLKKTDHPYTVILYFPLITIPLITPSTIAEWVPPTTTEWLLLICVGLVVQTAQYFMTLAYSGPSTSTVSIVNYLGTVFSIVFGYVIFSESIGFAAGAGIALIVLAVALNTVLAAKKKSRTL